MAWVVLIVAALTDVAMAVALKYTDRWKCFWPSLLGLLFANAAIYLLTHSLKESARRHSLYRLHWNQRDRHHDDRDLALSGECLARTALEHCTDLNRYCRSKIAESLTFRIRKEHFYGTTALC